MMEKKDFDVSPIGREIALAKMSQDSRSPAAKPSTQAAFKVGLCRGKLDLP